MSYLLQKYRAVAFSAYGLAAVISIIGIRPVMASIVHMTVLCTVAFFTASPLCVWIISVLFLLSFNFVFTQALMVCVEFLESRLTSSVCGYGLELEAALCAHWSI